MTIRLFLFLFLLCDIFLFRASLFAQRFEKINKAVFYLDNWTAEEKDFYLKKSFPSIKIRSFLFAYFNEKKEVSLKEKDFISTLIQFELDQAMQKKYHSQQELKNILLSLQLLKSYQWKGFFYQIIPFVAHPLQEVRYAAHALLQDVRDDRVFPFLMVLANSSQPINRIYAIEAFKELSDKRLTSFLLKHLFDKSKSVRYFSIEALEYLQEKKAIQNLKNLATRDKSIDVRVRAIEAIKNLHPKNSFVFFSTLLNDHQAPVRYAAAEALRSLRQTDVLSVRLKEEKNCKVQKKILQALAQENKIFQNKKEIMFFLENPSCDTDTLIWQIYASRLLADRHTLTILLAFLKHPSPNIKEETIWALHHILNQTKNNELSLQKKISHDLKTIIFNHKESLVVRQASLYALLPYLDQNQKEELKKLLQRKLFSKKLLYTFY